MPNRNTLVMSACCLGLFVIAGGPTCIASDSLPDGMELRRDLSNDGAKVHQRGQALWLELQPAALDAKQAMIPRLSAPIRSIQWQGAPDAELKFWPEQGEWVFSWKQRPTDADVIEVVFDAPPVLPEDCPQATAAGDGSIRLHAFQARTFGEKLRFEPQWYKNTVGYWTIPTDYATWDFEVDQPGTFSVALLQGCGAGQGGSDALLTLRQADNVATELPFQTIDTGHFQNFRWSHAGHVVIEESGTYELRIQPTRIAKNALFDVRAIHLVRQAKPQK